MPRLVYHLSTKLKNDATHTCIGQTDKVKLIRFLTRYRYATRAAPFCKLHGAYGKHTNMQNMNYINNCNDWNIIIPVTVFLVMLFNACFMYQPKADTNLLIIRFMGHSILGSSVQLCPILDDEWKKFKVSSAVPL